jgi:hypothetical protein
MRTALSALVVALSSGFALGQDAADIPRLTRELTAAKLEFGKKKAVAKDVALKQFDRAINALNNGPGAATVKLALIKEWEQKKLRFNQEGEWPGDEDLLGAGATYGAALSKAYVPVSAVYEKLVKAYGTVNDRDGATKIVDDKVAFEKQHFFGRERFVDGSKYRGSRYGGKDAIPFHLNVGKMTGNVFEGTVHQNVQVVNHPVFEVKGVVEGLRVTCQTTKVVQGRAQGFSFDGYILGENLVLVITPAGKASNATAVVKLSNPPKDPKKK